MNPIKKTVRALPIGCWKTVTVIFGVLAVLAFSRAGNDNFSLSWARLIGAVCGCIAVHAAFRGHKFRPISWQFPSSRPPLAASFVVVFVIAILTTALFPVYTNCTGNSKRQAVISELKSDGFALVLYADDHGNYTPKMTDPEVMRSLSPYLKESASLIDPVSHQPFIWMKNAGGIDRTSIKDPSSVIVAYSPVPIVAEDSWRGVLFLDGHAKCYKEAAFQAMMRDQPALLAESLKAKQSVSRKIIVVL